MTTRAEMGASSKCGQNVRKERERRTGIGACRWCSDTAQQPNTQHITGFGINSRRESGHDVAADKERSKVVCTQRSFSEREFATDREPHQNLAVYLENKGKTRRRPTTALLNNIFVGYREYFLLRELSSAAAIPCAGTECSVPHEKIKHNLCIGYATPDETGQYLNYNNRLRLAASSSSSSSSSSSCCFSQWLKAQNSE